MTRGLASKGIPCKPLPTETWFLDSVGIDTNHELAPRHRDGIVDTLTTSPHCLLKENNKNEAVIEFSQIIFFLSQ